MTTTDTTTGVTWEQVSAQLSTTPKFQVMTPLSRDEEAALRESITTDGRVHDAIEVDENADIIDGHHRAKIAKELLIQGIDIEPPPIKVVTGLTDQEKRSRATTLNMVRRHLSREDKRNLLQQCLKHNHKLSDRQIATQFAVDHKTVGSVRKDLEDSGEIPQSPSRTAKDGSQKPSTQPVRPPKPEAPAKKKATPVPTPPAPVEDEDEEPSLEQSSTLDVLHDDLEMAAEQLAIAFAPNVKYYDDDLTAEEAGVLVNKIKDQWKKISPFLTRATKLKRLPQGKGNE